MIDWMVECLTIFDLNQDTYFLAVYLFDNYFAKTSLILEDKDVHLVGVCSMFLASKHEDVKPLFMCQMESKISHGSFSRIQIIEKELEMTQTLGWRVSLVTPLHFLQYINMTIRNEYKLLGQDYILTYLNV